MESLNFEEVDQKLILPLWEDFAESIGGEQVRKAYGDYWVRSPVYGERVWVSYFGSLRVGWCSLRPDPVDPIVWQASGVWKEYQQSGIAPLMLKWCVKKTFELFPVAKAMFWAVSKYNPKFIEWNRKMLVNEWSIEVGEINYPRPGYVYFCIIKRDKTQRGESYGRDEKDP